MANTDTLSIPQTFNGIPTKYTFFDGFTRAGLGGKVLYVIGLPWISALMEAYRYNQSSKAYDAAVQLATTQNQIMANNVNCAPIISQQMPDLNPDVNPRFCNTEDARREAIAQLGNQRQ